MCRCLESSPILQTCLKSCRPGSWVTVASWSTLVVVSPAQSRFLMVGKVQREVCETHSPDAPECAGERLAVFIGKLSLRLLSNGCGP